MVHVSFDYLAFFLWSSLVQSFKGSSSSCRSFGIYANLPTPTTRPRDNFPVGVFPLSPNPFDNLPLRIIVEIKLALLAAVSRAFVVLALFHFSKLLSSFRHSS